MKLFVTGGTGFIGSHFLNQAAASGYDIVALRRSPNSNSRISLSKKPQWLDQTMDKVSVRDLKGSDVLVHLAAHTSNVPYDTLEKCLYWNVNVAIQLVRRAYEAGIRHVIVAGSCFEYGTSALRYERIPVTAPLEPTLSYPASKAAASIALSQLAIELKIKLSIHRIFQVYGEGEAENRLWPSLRRVALVGEDFEMTLGEQVRDFIPVEQVAKSLLDHIGNSDLKEGIPMIKNLGTGKPTTVAEFSSYWWKHWKAKGKLKIGALPYRENEVMRYVPEI